MDLVVQWEQHDQHRLLVCAGEEEKGGVVMMRGGGSGSGGGDVSSRRQVWRMHSGGTSDDGGGQWETLRSLRGEAWAGTRIDHTDSCVSVCVHWLFVVTGF